MAAIGKSTMGWSWAGSLDLSCINHQW
jgi:hypothetical protein